MTRVDSSSIAAIGYDVDSRELYVRFASSGATYVYTGVDDWEFGELEHAASKGAYVNQHIKPRHAARLDISPA